MLTAHKLAAAVLWSSELILRLFRELQSVRASVAMIELAYCSTLVILRVISFEDTVLISSPLWHFRLPYWIDL